MLVDLERLDFNIAAIVQCVDGEAFGVQVKDTGRVTVFWFQEAGRPGVDDSLAFVSKVKRRVGVSDDNNVGLQSSEIFLEGLG